MAGSFLPMTPERYSLPDLTFSHKDYIHICPDPRGAFLEASWNAGRERRLLSRFATRHRDGSGPRPRPLRAGARSSLTERLSASRKARPGLRNRRAGALRSAASRAGRQNGRPDAPSGAPAPSLPNETRAVMEECPDAQKSAGAGKMCLPAASLTLRRREAPS